MGAHRLSFQNPRRKRLDACRRSLLQDLPGSGGATAPDRSRDLSEVPRTYRQSARAGEPDSCEACASLSARVRDDETVRGSERFDIRTFVSAVPAFGNPKGGSITTPSIRRAGSSSRLRTSGESFVRAGDWTYRHIRLAVQEVPDAVHRSCGLDFLPLRSGPMARHDRTIYRAVNRSRSPANRIEIRATDFRFASVRSRAVRVRESVQLRSASQNLRGGHGRDVGGRRIADRAVHPSHPRVDDRPLQYRRFAYRYRDASWATQGQVI